MTLPTNSELEKLTRELPTLINQIGALTAKLKAKESAVAEKKREVQRKSEEVEKIKQEAQRKEVEKQRELDVLKAAEAKLEGEAKHLQDELAPLKHRYEGVERDVNTLKTNLERQKHLSHS